MGPKGGNKRPGVRAGSNEDQCHGRVGINQGSVGRGEGGGGGRAYQCLGGLGGQAEKVMAQELRGRGPAVLWQLVSLLRK